jgi:hypothetical protein
MIGRPITVESGATADDLAARCRELQEALNWLTDQAERNVRREP